MEQFLNDILFTKLLFFSFFLLTNPSIATKPAYIFPIFFLYYSIFYSHVRSNTSRTRIKDLWESLHAVDILAAIYDYHGRSWGGQLGPDPAGFKRRCRIGPWHRVSAKVSRYISISRRTIPTLSARRKTALSPRHSFCKHVCILGGMRISDVGWLRRVCTMHDVDIEHARHGTAKCAPRKTSASLSLLWSGFRFDPSHPRIW